MGDTERRRHRRGLIGLDPPPAFDLVIVDEADHIRNTETWAYRAVRWFCDNAEAVVLLSATPIQLGDPDLYTLLHLLRPDPLPSRREHEQMAEPNPHINAAIEFVRGAGPDWREHARAAIQAAIATPWGGNVLTADQRTQVAHDLLDNADPTPDDRLTLVGLLEGLYTFSPLINRTRRRDIGSFTTRKPETVAVDYAPEQQALHTDLIQLIGAMLARRHGDRNLRFMLTTVHRQLASCVFGLAPYLESILDLHLSQLELSEIGDEDSPDALSDSFDQFRAEVQSIVQRAQALDGPDPKLAAFLKVIHAKQALPNNKLQVFSSFRHTLAYLVAKLADQPIRTGLIHADIPEEDRRYLQLHRSRHRRCRDLRTLPAAHRRPPPGTRGQRRYPLPTHPRDLRNRREPHPDPGRAGRSPATDRGQRDPRHPGADAARRATGQALRLGTTQAGRENGPAGRKRLATLGHARQSHRLPSGLL
jgi:hypothetical protein